MTGLIVLALIVPLFGGVLALLGRARAWGRAVNLIASLVALVVAMLLLERVSASGIQAVQIGDWPVPFGITFVVDHLSALMVLVTAVVAVTAAMYSLADVDAARERYSYHAMTQLLLFGVNGAFLTGDLFNLYVWFEVLLMASFVLMVLGGEPKQLEGTTKYFALSLMSSTFFLIAVGLLYGATGALNMADLANRISGLPTGLMNALAVLFLIGFGLKAGMFPLFFWLPASYHTPPATVSALFAGLLTKVGVYAIIRTFTLLFTHDSAFTHTIILVLGGLSMLVGVLGAVAQTEVRKLLSFHIISQIGYMIVGLGLFTPFALTGAVFYVLHHIIVKTNLFLIGGLMARMQGSYQLKQLGGAYATTPWLAVLFLIPALSLAGIPPLSGFWAKLVIVRSGLEIGQYLIVGVSLLVSLLTLYSMTKIWNEAFWKAQPASLPRKPQPAPIMMVVPIAFLACITILIGLNAQVLYTFSERAAQELINPEPYIRAVLGVNP